MGGGTGLAVLLRALKPEVGNEIGDLTAIVTVSDDGGSSGRLRREFGVPAPGDIRNCLVALADDEDLVAKLFQYRFAMGEGLAGHSFGNLFLTALTGITGDFSQAILTAESILSVRGRILPATLSDVRLRARGVSGKVYEGESAIGLSGEALEEIGLEPARVAPFPAAVRAIAEADLILLGPGSLYTSILPNLLISGIAEALGESRAGIALVLNLMTQPGETDGMDAMTHLEALRRLGGNDLVDLVLAHRGEHPETLLKRYKQAGAEPVRAVETLPWGSDLPRLVLADLAEEGDFIRHDPAKLRQAVLQLVRERQFERRVS
ncbi:MAG: uridine diphosphate-N-acetylglucosamine-binding protein YvcK [bacterium]|nr:uridine diphosphate-N-acetylglucosamine-binding protein YvcK [bacterium]